jgi:hypothetical protein
MRQRGDGVGTRSAPLEIDAERDEEKVMIADMRSGYCPLCDHREILELKELEWMEELNRALLQFHLTLRPLTGKAFTLAPQLPLPPQGRYMIYICRGCGYVQQFAAAPRSIPVGRRGTRLIKGPVAEGPYR